LIATRLLSVSRHIGKRLREKRLQGYREEVGHSALYLQAEQVILTQKQIARYLPQPAIVRDPQVRELLREVCREGEEGSKPGKSPERPSFCFSLLKEVPP
jgi:hypothetical protein